MTILDVCTNMDDRGRGIRGGCSEKDSRPADTTEQADSEPELKCSDVVNVVNIEGWIWTDLRKEGLRSEERPHSNHQVKGTEYNA